MDRGACQATVQRVTKSRTRTDLAHTQDGNDNPICKTEKGTQMYRTDFGTLWEKARVGCFKRTASKHVYYQG